MNAAPLEKTTWSIVSRADDKVRLEQRSFEKKDIDETTGARHRKTKPNDGKAVKVLKNGMLVRVQKQPKRAQTDYLGLWRVFSIKNNESGIALDIARPERTKPINKVPWAGINVGVRALLDGGLEILEMTTTGIAVA